VGSGGTAGAVGVVLAVVVAVPLGLSVLAGSDTPAAASSPGQLVAGQVPNGWEPWVLQAGSICPEVSAPLVAAQIEAESGWNPQAVSPAGAQGLSQFMPGTWASYGRDSDGNGQVSPFDPGDAILAQGTFDCVLAAEMTTAVASGQVTGDVVDLVLASYNAGSGAVRAAGGVPLNGETPAYVTRIRSLEARYTAVGTGVGAGAGIVAGGPFASNMVAAGMQWLGTVYAWGGGDATGPTRGIRDGGVADSFGDYTKVGFDCSGLVTYAVAQASGGAIRLPHSAAAQSQMGQPVPTNAIVAGDVLFFADGGGVHHTGIYLGGGQMVNAPQSGDVVKVSTLTGWAGEIMTARRFG
jgi:cell wall-associated NlpC family hydrolase